MANDTLVNNEYKLNGYNENSVSIYYSAMSYAFLAGNFLNNLMSSTTMKALGEGFTNKLDFVRFIRVYPFNVMGKAYSGSTITCYIGNTTVEIPTYANTGGDPKDIIHITKYFELGHTMIRFTQSEPYENIQVYLPYVGYIDLDTDEVRASKGSLKVDLVVDVRSGNGTYSLSRFDEINKLYYNFYTTQTNFGLDLPIGAADTSRQAQSMFNASLNGLAGIGKIAIGATSGNPFLLSGGVGNLISSVTQSVNARQQTLIQRGTLGQYPTTFNNPHAIYFIVKTRKINDYDSFKSYYGKPLNQTKSLSSLKGMTFIPNPKLEINNITKEEFDLLNEKLVDGIIL